ncbi:hypothetical protein [Streptomyces sp. NPDC058086]|uniref:hypothetical protein n=1 Tax=Streptomyces sp. NPDC058086 TaxID=3346334 RepID=UPI0036E4D1F9
MPPQMKLTAITLDCAGPETPAAFYQQATGLELHPKSNGDFAERRQAPAGHPFCLIRG